MNTNYQIFSSDLKVFFRLREPKATEATNVYMCFCLKDKVYKIATGIRVHPQHWHKGKQLAYTSTILSALDNRNNEIANKRIEQCRLAFEDYKNYLCEHLSSIDNADVSYLKEILYYKKKTMAKKKYANVLLYLRQIVDKQSWEEGSKKFYMQAVNYIEKYTTDKNITLKDVNDIDYDFILQLRDWLKEQTSIRNKKDNDKLSIKTINAAINNLKHILELIEDDSIYDITKAQIYKIKSLKQIANADNEIALTEEEVERIYNLELKGNEAKVRDAFVFQCLTGQRFNSIKNFATSFTEITTKEGQQCWEVVQNKGKKVVKVPVSNIAKTILERNDNNIKYRHNSVTNEVLKEIARKADITEECTYTKQTCEGIKQHKRKRYELITTHTARRSFVTISKQNDIDDRQVMSVTGHTTRTMLDLYNKVDASKAAVKVADKLNNIFDKDTSKKKETNTTNRTTKAEILEDLKDVLAYLGADGVVVREIANIDDANRLIYTKYERELRDIGIDYHIIKDLYNDNSKATLKEKRAALIQIVNAIKEKEDKVKRKVRKKKDSRKK